jgi:type VI protein secretion system component VasF
MSTSNGRTAEDVRRELESEREQLADAVEELRRGVHDATDVRKKLRKNLPVATAAALAAGFVLAGGVGATIRLFTKRR